MMDRLQEYIDFLKSEKEKALKGFINTVGETREFYSGVNMAFSLAISKAELLLPDHPTGAGTEGEDYGGRLISAIENLERLGLWEQWKEENPSLVSKLSGLTT